MRLQRLLLKRIWLPEGLYEALPYLYIAIGLIALAAALFLPEWAWIIPWACVFGFTAIHIGLKIVALRHRFRRPKSARKERPGADSSKIVA